ncbi:hypothetical protein KJ632_02855 [Patescibacteria group bacterium]|nr:hypothetical protein [Patescibacteria group bacterium]
MFEKAREKLKGGAMEFSRSRLEIGKNEIFEVILGIVAKVNGMVNPSESYENKKDLDIDFVRGFIRNALMERAYMKDMECWSDADCLVDNPVKTATDLLKEICEKVEECDPKDLLPEVEKIVADYESDYSFFNVHRYLRKSGVMKVLRDYVFGKTLDEYNIMVPLLSALFNKRLVR